MKLRLLLLPALLALLPFQALGQTQPVEGLRDSTPGIHALTGATIVVAPGNVLDSATVIIRDGVIEAVGTDVTAPADAVVWDLSGHTIYPGFIDAYSHVGQREELTEEEEDDPRGTVSWNPQIRSFVDAAGDYRTDDGLAGDLRAQGFTAALSVPELGMFRGSAAVVSLAGGSARDQVVRPGVAQGLGLTRDTSVGATYPTSAMGGMVFVRQVLSDAQWYRDAQARYSADPSGIARPESNRALAALEPVVGGSQPLLIEARDEEEFLRAASFADEFPVDLWIRGSGSEYQLLDPIAATGLPVILPVNFPGAPDVGDDEMDALGVSLGQLLHWRHAPENPARMADAGIEFAFTTAGLDEVDEFLPNLRAAVEHGLDPDRALSALTNTAAGMLGIDRTHGTIEVGKVASLVVMDGDLFMDETELVETWVDGDRYPAGTSVVLGQDGQMRTDTDGEGEPMARGPAPIVPVPVTLDHSHDHEGEDAHDESGAGGVEPSDEAVEWPTIPVLPSALAQQEELIYPLMEYGRTGLPDQPDVVLIQGGTVWTQGPQGIIEGGDVLVRNGQIAEIGQGLDAPAGAVVVDASGKHVTPGLIDPHIHSGLSGGVNETGSAIVPEVRIGDVISANNIWMYRQMAGGLTTAHVMHGSANPIGGQNQIVKMRWGASPEDLKFENGSRTVKFALGENVTRSPSRYPNTRQGVQQIMLDHFEQARDYQRAWTQWEETNEGLPPRRDYRMEALLDILSDEIKVMSHSYRQDEILTLMHTAEEAGFDVTAFHHGVEAYRVAPELAERGVGAIVWSDWGSFKMEAYNATLYNVRGLLDAGVVTSLHSDNSQIASRMNWEAAKMLRTGVSEEEALSLVTSGAAELLRISDRVGSLESGKDADLVIWSESPLAVATVAEQTWIDGRKYFDIDEDAQAQIEIRLLRDEIIQQIREDR